ncbi:MAG: hypothetical protein HN982_13525 [Candidatus Marinimicrobia bacterium]|nr:hypothetical protein [Candidatus Neomarinimicrobiota bacterium]
MSRYRFTGIKIDKDTGNRVMKTTLYPEIRINDGDRFVYPIDGDRLESLAHRYYGDSTLWWIIATANNIRDGSFGLPPDEKLRIPGNVQQITQDLQTINEDT